MVGFDGVHPIDPAYALPVRTMQRLRGQQQAGGGASQSASAVPSFIESSFTTRVEYEAWRRTRS